MPEPSIQSHPAAVLLKLLANPPACGTLSLPQWETVVRLARMSRLLSTLRQRIEASGVLPNVPVEVLRHMDSDAVLTRHRRQMVLWQMSALAKEFRDFGGSVILLKGASYIAQNLPIAEGRLPADVDVMVPRSRLDEAESMLRKAGWNMSDLSDYDDRYYREWSHELPPMRHPELPLELDLHHTILPVTGRITPDAAALIASAVALPGGPFSILNAPDQLLHAAAQLFQDADCINCLRDLVDIDGLIRHFADHENFWQRVVERAVLHGLQRPLWYALHYAQSLLRTPLPGNILDAIPGGKPPATVRVMMDSLIPCTLLPGNPDIPATRQMRYAGKLLLARSVWLRMPPNLLARHLWHKFTVGLPGFREHT
jgi:hypothetical protein